MTPPDRSGRVPRSGRLRNSSRVPRQPDPRWPLAIALLAALSATLPAQKGGIDLHGPYDAVAGWLKPVEEGWILHPVSVVADTPNRIFIASTGVTPKASAPPGLTTFDPKVAGATVNHQLVVVNRDGRIVERWTRWYDRFGAPHKVAINPYDRDRHVWVVDRASQQVMKFTNDGRELVMAVGERGVAGADDRHFNQPTDIAFLEDGTFFVSDGEVNTRVVKFDRAGRFVASWGDTGPAQSRLGPPHSVAVDGRGRVYVVDRGSNRVKIFDESGTYLDEWPGFVNPSRILIARDRSAWVLDGGANRAAKYDLSGSLITYFGTAGTFPGGMANPHDFSVDSEGNLYVVNGYNQTVDKYVPKKHADRFRLVGRPLGSQEGGSK